MQAIRGAPVTRGYWPSPTFGTLLEFRGRGKEDRRGGGEDLWVLGSHILDMIRALGGAPSSCYARLGWKGHAVTADDVFDGPEGIGPLAGDNLQAVYQMKDGVTAHFASVRNQAGNPRRYGLQIFGSKGVIELIEGYGVDRDGAQTFHERTGVTLEGVLADFAEGL